MRRTMTTVTTFALVAALGACTSTSVNTTPAGVDQVVTTGSSHNSPAATTSATSSAAKKAAGIGDTIDLDSTKAGNVLEVTLTKVVDPSKVADIYSTPITGRRFVAIQLRITNKGQAPYHEDPQRLAKVKDAAGQIYGADFAADTTSGPLMDSGLSLAPGDSALGFLVFQVPTGQKVARVQYTLSMLGGAVAQWTIG